MIDTTACAAQNGARAVLGPRPVFFTGGTALRALSRRLTTYTHNSVHIVTPFDSGGSSAALRRTFAMPAVGDIRNRLLALADETMVPERVRAACGHRLPEQGKAEDLRSFLRALGEEEHPFWQDIPEVYGGALRLHLRFFLERMSDDFEPQAACLGNLMLAGGYLQHKRDFGPVLAFFSRLLHANGVVLPVVDESLHLAAELDNGAVFVGQHHFRLLPRPVRRIFLTVHEPDRRALQVGGVGGTGSGSVKQGGIGSQGGIGPAHIPCRPPLSASAAAYLHSAGLICYPMGSFYTSVLANLLPRGVGQAVAEAPCPKIFIPNSGDDAELHGLNLVGQATAILQQLREDAPAALAENLLQTVLVDSRNGRYEGGLGADVRVALADLGLRLEDRPLVRENEPAVHDPELTARAVLEHAQSGGRP